MTNYLVPATNCAFDVARPAGLDETAAEARPIFTERA
jgi:hypothetical protein